MNGEYIPQQPMDMPMQPYQEPFEYANIPTNREDEKLVEQLDPLKIIEKIDHTLRGEYYDSDKQLWVKFTEGKPLVNEKGVRDIHLEVQSVINLNSVFGNLKDQQIRKIVVDLGKDLCFKLSLKWREYDMEKIHIRTIPKFITRMAFIALTRGEDALTLRMMRTMIRSSESNVRTMPLQENGKKFSLNPFKLFR